MEDKTKVSTYRNGEVRRLKTFEEIEYEFAHPENRYVLYSNQKAVHRFNRKYPKPEKRGDVVM